LCFATLIKGWFFHRLALTAGLTLQCDAIPNETLAGNPSEFQDDFSFQIAATAGTCFALELVMLSNKS
jgi:hypothetical protein